MNEFKPNWVSPPADTVRDILNEVPETDSDTAHLLAQQFNRPYTDMLRFMKGDLRIGTKLALQLSLFLGGSESFWLKRDLQYEESLNSKTVQQSE